MTPISIKNGSWSPYESGSVYNDPEYHLNKLKIIAINKKGKLISTEYKGSYTKL